MSNVKKGTVQPEKWKLAPHVLKLETSIIREVLKISSRPGVISFAGGLPAPEMFPMNELKRISVEVLDKYGAQAVQYGLSRGITELRELLAKMATAQGAPSTVDNILLTNGSQQGIELLARVFIEPGDYILTENPTYLGALQAFNYYRARYCTVPMDKDGMIVDKAAKQIEKYRPKFIYCVSTFQNPTGVTLSVERRKQLAELAANYNIPLVDDDPYSQIRFAGQPMPNLKSFGGDGVVWLQTFSKIVAPGFRIGWMNAPNHIIAQFEKVKQCVDLHTTTHGQYIMHEFLAQGLLAPHIERIKADYLAKRNLMIQTMKEKFPEGITWTEPEGGLFLWVELPEHVSARDLFPKAIDLKVAYVIGAPFFPNKGKENTLRLNFSNCTHDGIREGITRLGKLFKENI